MNAVLYTIPAAFAARAISASAARSPDVPTTSGTGQAQARDDLSESMKKTIFMECRLINISISP
jgi:hypothetical protein